MLSEDETSIITFIESNLLGNNREEARLYHYSVVRKLWAVRFWFQNVEMLIQPDLILSTQNITASGDAGLSSNYQTDSESTITKISSYIDAFFMSGKSTLDTFAHEVRNLYGFGGHSGDLYFENALDLLAQLHSNSELNNYLSSTNIRNLQWYQELKAYRHASTHESIIAIQPSVEMDFFTGKWKPIILKLPLDPAQKPLQYNGKNFIETGKLIRDGLQKLLIQSYSKVIIDIRSNRTAIIP